MTVARSTAVRQICRNSSAMVLAAFAGVASAAQWLPVRDVDLAVQPGSVLDLSALVEPGPAGKHGWAMALDDGHIGFQNQRHGQRFLSASLVPGPASGGLPDKDTAIRLAHQLRMAGYNAVRLHFVDAALMSGRDKDFDFDPEQLDRFYYLLAQLKKEGIYWIIDGLTSWNGAYGGVHPHRWIKKYNLKLDLYYDPTAQAHWRRLLADIYGRKNPYTGLSTLADPALLGVILVNEGGIGFLTYTLGRGHDQPIPESLAEPFHNWLRTRYETDAALRAAWGGKLGSGESLNANVRLPEKLRGNGPRDRDFMRFVIGLEQETFAWMQDDVRRLGFGGLVTSYNNWGFFQNDITRKAVDWVDMHAYQSLPSRGTDPGSTLAQTSAVGDSARFVRSLMGKRQWDKPFSVTEYGQPFWNTSRHEASALVPAYAALQGWDLVCHFAESSVVLNYDRVAYSRGQAIYPHGVGMDPILHSGERLAALLYARGDVAASPSRIVVQMDSERLLEKTAGWAQLRDTVSQLGLLGGFGISIDAAASPMAGRTYVIDDHMFPSGPFEKLGEAAVRLRLIGADNDRLGAMKSAGLLPIANRTDLSRQVYQSDTGELLLEAPARRFSIDTPRTDAVVVPAGTAASGALTVQNPSAPVLVAVSSMDGAPVEASKRLLLFVLTDAQNSGMQFANDSRVELRKLGGLPVQLQRVSLDFEMKSGHGTTLRAYALSLGGKRRDAVPVTPTADGLRLHVDTATLPQGPTTLFELVQE